RGRRHGVRSWRGGCGGGHTVRTRWRGRPRTPRGCGPPGAGRSPGPRERCRGGRERRRGDGGRPGDLEERA
ncbi:hypothetical protein NGM37_53325, partial [Streptomyces sp. TRM76130]|nr:hypothetical protein [Streptomyces sp. TRM76130]